MSTLSNDNQWLTIPDTTRDKNKESKDKKFRDDYCHLEKFKKLYIDTSNSLKKTVAGSNQALSLDDMKDEEILSELAKKFPDTSIILDITDQLFICFDSFWGEWFIHKYQRWVSYPKDTFLKLE